MPGGREGPRAVLMVSNSRSENTSAKMLTNSTRAWCVDGAEDGLLPRRSSTQVMSIPVWGIDGIGVEDGMGCLNTASGGEIDGGRVVPASATREAWWLTLNSILTCPWLEIKQGRRCGAGVRLM